jgi:hypothetical protein
VKQKVLLFVFRYLTRSEIWILAETDKDNDYRHFEAADGTYWCQWHSCCYTEDSLHREIEAWTDDKYYDAEVVTL